MAELNYKGKKQIFLEATQQMNAALLQYASAAGHMEFGLEQEARLMAEMRLKTGLPTEMIQQSIDDLVLTGRLKRLAITPKPTPPIKISTQEETELNAILSARPKE